MPETEYAKIISKNLRNIAYRAGKNQADISRDLKINKATVSSWMNGTRVPRMDKIDLLCHYFNVSRRDIMEEHIEGSDDGYYLDPKTVAVAQELFENPDLRMLFDAARDVKPENLQLAAEMLKRMKETNPDG